MGYVRLDAVEPAVNTYLAATRFKNLTLRHWPKALVDGVEVFATVYYYLDGVGVLQTPMHLEVYKLLGIKVADLQAQSYEGVASAYLYVDGVDVAYGVTPLQITTYIEEFSPLIYPDNPDVFNSDPAPDPLTNLNPDPLAGTEDELWDENGWIYSYITYEPPTATYVDAAISDTDIFALIDANDKNTLWYDEEDSSRLTCLALLDSGSVMFEKSMRVVQKTIDTKNTYTVNLHRGRTSSTGLNTTRYLKSVVIEYRFRRIKAVDDPSVTEFITTIGSEVAALEAMRDYSPVISNSIRRLGVVGATIYSSYAQQLISMFRYVVPVTETALNYKGYLKVSGMAALKSKEFMKVFGGQVRSGFSKKKVEWYKKALVVIIDIITIVIAVVVFIFTGGNMYAVATVFAVGALVQSALAMYWSKNGDYGAAAYAGKHAQYLATTAAVAGALAMANDPWTMEALLYATNIAVQQYGTEDLQVAVAVASAAYAGYSAVNGNSQVLSTISFLNQSFAVYANYISPPAEGIAELAEELATTEQALEDTAGPEKFDVVEREFSDPYTNWIDFNEKMGSMPYMLTHGLNRNLMERYYSANY